MIHYLTGRVQRYTTQTFAHLLRRELGEALVPVAYESVFARRGVAGAGRMPAVERMLAAVPPPVYAPLAGASHPRLHWLHGRLAGARGAVDLAEVDLDRLKRTGGLFIFSDLERLSAVQGDAAAELANRLAALGPGVRVLNHPARVMGRFELLRSLHDAGRNAFNAHRLDQSPRPGRFPVFVRIESDHTGAASDLLHGQAELDRYIADLRKHGTGCRHGKLAVEFLDTADGEGLYRKYSAYVVGDRVIARHLLLSDHWMLKLPDFDRHDLDAELRFLDENPHADELRDIARHAGVDYGRIDYGLHEGRVQVWEINTNPFLISRKSFFMPERGESQRQICRQLAEAIHAACPATA